VLAGLGDWLGLMKRRKLSPRLLQAPTDSPLPEALGVGSGPDWRTSMQSAIHKSTWPFRFSAELDLPPRHGSPVV
jgi:hypothetical protein